MRAAPGETELGRPLGLYLVTLYFVLTGFMEAIQKYREWEQPLALSPIAEQSIWQLLVHILIYLAVAYLIWHRASLGRLAALIYGYLMLPTYLGVFALYLFRARDDLSFTPLLLLVGVFHVAALVPLLVYLQRAKQKRKFHVSLLDILTSSDS